MSSLRWLLGVLAVLAVALVIQSGLLAYAAYVLLGVLLLTRLLTREGLHHIEAERTVSAEEVEAGERIEVEVTVRNAGRLPLPWVLLEDQLPGYALRQRPPRLRVKGKRLQIRLLRPGQETTLRYKVECANRGFYQVGPLVLESGDLFGLHRRYRVVAPPAYVMVYPKVVPLLGYDVASRRPIGDVRLVHRLYEDPTRIAGVRPYEAGDPLNRIHWRATARAGRLHSKIYDPSTLAGATLLLDFHRAGYPSRGEPHRSDLAATTAASLAHAVSQLGQQVGLVTNAGDAAERLSATNFRAALKRDSSDKDDRRLARAVRAEDQRVPEEHRRPLIVPTGRGAEQFQRIREALARAELNDGLTLAQLAIEAAPRLPRDATVLAVLPAVPVETALALGALKRQGYAVSVVLVALSDEVELAYGLLAAEGIRDVRPLAGEAALPELCQAEVTRTPYTMALS
ncbi:MAG TPA: DUF58 domain-containing protein [Gemmataceae bacterium]|jgi:uncharacterized protein (DUF58 family)